MLTSLHVKNLALIDEEEIEFAPGLNILSGETGAGKSIILGALALALGGRVEKGMLRHPEDEAYIEAVFSVNEAAAARLAAADINVYDDQIILSRRISAVKSVARINGETYPAVKLREAGEILVDIYGQNDHQSLLKKNRQLELLDDYATDSLGRVKARVAEEYRLLSSLKKEYEAENLDESMRLREISFLEHEIGEITAAELKPKEDESLEYDYKRMVHSQTVAELLTDSYNRLSGGMEDELGAALRNLSQAAGYDDEAADLEQELADAESIISTVKREIYDHIEGLSYDPATLVQVEARLDLVNDLKAKYGKTIESIYATLEEKEERLKRLKDHDAYVADMADRIAASERKLEEASDELSTLRRAAAADLSTRTEEALKELNFLDARFEISLMRTENIGPTGYDDAEFMISVNPGEPLKPLKQVASGGELSRMMLALKTVLATTDDIGCFIFDEIDAGISGRTALAVAHRLATLAADVQIICITHLPQIASMADCHFLIEKAVSGGSTISSIRELEPEERADELARMLGGEDISQAARANALELLEEAKKYKKR